MNLLQFFKITVFNYWYYLQVIGIWGKSRHFEHSKNGDMCLSWTIWRRVNLTQFIFFFNFSFPQSFSFNPDLLPKQLVCTTCGLLADKICRHCQDALCSLECHAAKHKKDAKGTAEENVTTKSQYPRPVKAESIQRVVKVTAVLNHRMVFVRPAEDHHAVAFVRMMYDTVHCALKAENLKSRPSVGSLVLAKFDYYQRALVLRNLDDTNVVVAFIDYGNVEVRKFCELKVMPDELKKKKRFAQRIRLSKVEHDIMNNKALLYLYNLMAFGTELIYKFDANVDPDGVELMASDKWVNSMIQLTNIDNIVVPKVRSVVDLVSGTTFRKRLVWHM